MSESDEDSDLEQQNNHLSNAVQNYSHLTRGTKQERPSRKKQKLNKKNENGDSDEEADENFEYEDDEEYYRKFMESTTNVPLHDEDDLRRQLRLEKELAEKKLIESEAASGEPTVKTRKDPDGTEYEWDPVVKGWFPKVRSFFSAF